MAKYVPGINFDSKGSKSLEEFIKNDRISVITKINIIKHLLICVKGPTATYAENINNSLENQSLNYIDFIYFIIDSFTQRLVKLLTA